MKLPWRLGRPRGPVSGFRFFVCDECGHSWAARTRDCWSPSGEDCDVCGNFQPPEGNEPHPEWPTDGSGNLLPMSGESETGD